MAVALYPLVDVTGDAPDICYCICDTEAELPTDHGEGSLAWTKDTKKFWIWNGSTWVSHTSS